MHSKVNGSFIGGLLALLISWPGVAPAADGKIWAALREGGKVVLLADADHDIRPGLARLAPGNCAAEINLSPRGRRQAVRIGEEFRAHGVTVSEVLASPYCRSVDTGKLAFGHATAAPYLMPEAVVSDAQATANMKRVLRTIREHRGSSNLTLVTYAAYVSDIVMEPAENAEFFVLQPNGAGFDVIGSFQVAVPDDVR